ncbi:hypothetical protein L1065_09740 [Nereida sp. MMG024]|nr:hypothetical protein [Nereida sp. MMG025]MCF6445022.1 hypothetical protein [Nereida sp. MMG025]
MMGQVKHQEQLFYRLRLEDYVPEDHLLRHVDRFVDFSALRGELAALYSHTGGSPVLANRTCHAMRRTPDPLSSSTLPKDQSFCGLG